jgi:hypothetical protein
MTVLDFMRKPITNAAEADAFSRAMVASGKVFHYDDSPDTIVDVRTGAPVFTVEECDVLGARVDEIYALENYSPLGLVVFLTNSPPEHLALDAELLRLYGQGLTVEQRDCLGDENRSEEREGMLDDMQARLGVSGSIVDAVRALRGDSQRQGHAGQ